MSTLFYKQTISQKSFSSSFSCQKDPAVNALQDLIMHGLEGLSVFSHKARELGFKDREIDEKVSKYLYLSNKSINFSLEVLKNNIYELSKYKNRAENLYKFACKTSGIEIEDAPECTKWQPAEKTPELISQGSKVCATIASQCSDIEISGFREIIKFGLGGISSSLEQIKKYEPIDHEIYDTIYELLSSLSDTTKSIDDYVELAIKCGKLNYQAMETLNKIYTRNYGIPEPTQVRITPVKGKAILISGSDFKTLDAILHMTHGKKINIYTHGEMISAHAYPEIKKHKHLVGSYGEDTANTKKDFEKFPGAILIASNFTKGPEEFYRGRIFSTEDISWPGIFTIDLKDIKKLISAAYDSQGFIEDIEEKYITIGFGEKSIQLYTKRIFESVKENKIKHFVMIGGCDIEQQSSDYFKNFLNQTPQNSIILTLACDKFRKIKETFGEVDKIPRILDLGQFNDAFPAIKMSIALSEKLGVKLNELPLSIIISWNEQKTIATLLTLLYLGITNIKLGANLPAYLSPKLLKLLFDKFKITQITTPEKDIEEIIKRWAA